MGPLEQEARGISPPISSVCPNNIGCGDPDGDYCLITQELNAEGNGWATLLKSYRDHHKQTIDNVNEDIDALLVFVRPPLLFIPLAIPKTKVFLGGIVLCRSDNLRC